MDLTEQIFESLGTLTVNKMRTGLAILGIVIGIGSVIALISLGQGTKQSIESQIQDLGANLLTVSPGALRTGAVRGASGGGTTLTLEDAKAISTSTQITTINTVSPEFSRRAQVTTGGQNTNTQIMGVTPAYADVHKVNVTSGNFVSQRDVDASTKVAVLGPQVVTDLFGEGADPLGQTIRVSGQTLTIIGVTVSKGGSGFLNQDDIIYAPISTVMFLQWLIKNLSDGSLVFLVLSVNGMNEFYQKVGDYADMKSLVAAPNYGFSVAGQMLSEIEKGEK